MKKTLLLLLASLFATAPAFSADEQPRKPEEIFTKTLISIPSLVEQHIEYSAITYSGKACKLFTEKEVNYWVKLWALSVEVALSPRDSDEFSRKSMSSAALQKLEKRTNYFLGIGCGTPELISKVRDLKKRMRLSGLALKQLSEANGEALMDLHKEPND